MRTIRNFDPWIVLSVSEKYNRSKFQMTSVKPLVQSWEVSWKTSGKWSWEIQRRAMSLTAFLRRWAKFLPYVIKIY